MKEPDLSNVVWVDETPYTIQEITPPDAAKVEEPVGKSVEVTEETAGEIEVEFDIVEPVSPEAS